MSATPYSTGAPHPVIPANNSIQTRTAWIMHARVAHRSQYFRLLCTFRTVGQCYNRSLPSINSVISNLQKSMVYWTLEYIGHQRCRAIIFYVTSQPNLITITGFSIQKREQLRES